VPTRLSFPPSVALIVLLVAACGSVTTSPSPSGSAPSPSGSPPPSAGPTPSAAVLLLKVTTEGGFIGPTATLASLPTVAVYRDGRIFTPGAMPAIFPGPLVQALTVRDVGPAAVAAIVAAIGKAGLDKPGGGDPGVTADTGTTVFTVVVDGATVTTRFGGMNGGPGKPGGNPSSAAALDLLTRLTDPAETWGRAAASETTYVPTAYRIFVVPGGPEVDPTASQGPMAWPLATTLDAFGTPAIPDRGIAGLRAGVVRGADAATLAPFLARANAMTPVTSGGKTYTLYVRPLLPDESGGA